MSRSSKFLVFALSATLVCSVLLLSGQQQPSTAGPFTAEQATAGRTAFQANCAGCHGDGGEGKECLEVYGVREIDGNIVLNMDGK